MFRAFLLFVASIAAAVTSAAPLRIMFCGNSHTAFHNVPSMVAASIGSNVETRFISGGLLQDIAQNPAVSSTLASFRPHVVVLQGAGLSQSHQYVYPHSGAVSIANRAKRAKARPILFAEWSRKTVDETNYILGVYQKIRRETSADIVPTCKGFDIAKKQGFMNLLWAEDGNHSALHGAYLASMMIALEIDANAPLKFVPNGVTASQASTLREIARLALRS